MCNDVGVLVLCYMWVKIVMLICFCMDEYGAFCGFCFVANITQWMAYGMLFIFKKCVIPFLFYLCKNAIPRNIKILSLGKGKKIYFNEVEQVIGEKKYKNVILKFVIINSSSRCGSVNYI